MSIDFVALDFETANGFRGSPCAVGLVKVRGGEIVEELSTLIQPPPAAPVFDSRNVRIHGIVPDDVVAAPSAAEALGLIEEFCEDLPLAAHNAAFDLGVLTGTAEVTGVALRAHRHFCTVKLARSRYELKSYSLPYAAEAAGHIITEHHEALADARACAAIALDILGALEAEEIQAGQTQQIPGIAEQGVPELAGNAYVGRLLKSAGVPFTTAAEVRAGQGISEPTAAQIERVRLGYLDWISRPNTVSVEEAAMGRKG